MTASSVTPVKEGEAPQEVSAEDEVNVFLFTNDDGVTSTLIQTGAGIEGCRYDRCCRSSSSGIRHSQEKIVKYVETMKIMILV